MHIWIHTNRAFIHSTPISEGLLRHCANESEHKVATLMLLTRRRTAKTQTGLIPAPFTRHSEFVKDLFYLRILPWATGTR